MKTHYKSLIKDITPPFLLRNLKYLTNKGVYFKGKYTSWHEAQKNSTGYDTELILDKVKNATLKVKTGEAVYERDSVLFDKIEYSFPVLAALLRVAVANKEKLNILDFGGSLGSSYYQCKTFLSNLDSLQWNIIEQPHFVSCGKELFADETLKFYETIDECLTEQKPNMVLLSSVLQYLEEPYQLLGKLANLDIDYLLIDRTPCTKTKEILTIQIVPPHIYPASYPSWIFNEQQLLRYLEEKYSPLCEFESSDGSIGNNELKADYKGFFLKKCTV